MPRTHPYLKGLAETRARADAAYQKALALTQERELHLTRLIQRFEKSRQPAENAIAQAQEAADAALRIRKSCDQLIRRINEELDPEAIEPINAWQGRYGRRGALSQAVQKIIEDAYPNEVTTDEIAEIVQWQFGFSFSTPHEIRQWRDGVIRPRLKSLTYKGLIERLHDASIGTKELGRWRALPSQYAPGSLNDFATKAGIPLTFMSDALLFEPGIDDESDDDLPR